MDMHTELLNVIKKFFDAFSIPYNTSQLNTLEQTLKSPLENSIKYSLEGVDPDTYDNNIEQIQYIIESILKSIISLFLRLDGKGPKAEYLHDVLADLIDTYITCYDPYNSCLDVLQCYLEERNEPIIDIITEIKNGRGYGQRGIQGEQALYDSGYYELEVGKTPVRKY